MAAVARHAVEVHQSHDVGGVPPEVRERLWARPKGAVETLRYAQRHRQKVRAARRPVVNRRGGEQMPHIVQLVVPAGAPAGLGGVELRLGAEIAIFGLRARDLRDPFVHPFQQRKVAGYGVHARHRLEPLVDIAVAPVVARVPGVGRADEFEVAELSAVGGASSHGRLERGQRARVATREPIAPEATSPAGLAGVWGAHLRRRERRPGHENEQREHAVHVDVAKTGYALHPLSAPRRAPWPRARSWPGAMCKRRFRRAFLADWGRCGCARSAMPAGLVSSAGGSCGRSGGPIGLCGEHAAG